MVKQLIRRLLAPADPWLFLLCLICTLLGLFAIFDAGYARSILKDRSLLPREFNMQLIYTIAAMILGALAALIPIRIWSRYSKWIFGVSLALVLLVMVPGLNQTMSGATRWVRVGPIQIQPSEFAKGAVILFLAGAFALRQPWPKRVKVKNRFDWLDRVGMPKLVRAIPLLLVGVLALKVEREPDLGTAAVILAITGAMLWLGGVSRKSLVTLGAIGFVGLIGVATLEPYRLERITNHPARWTAEHMDDVGYQTVQSEIAMADGGLKGVGVGNGRAKHMLPAATTDFVTATIAEETGLVGSLAVLGLLGAIVARLFVLAKQANSEFSRLYLLGVASWIAIQTCVNVLMANGTLPPIGIPLPFFSSGGSSLLALWLAMGVAQSAVAEQPQEDLVGETHRNRWRNRRPRISRA